MISSICSDELSDYCERTGGINFELWSGTVEILNTCTERIKIATILVTNTHITFFSISTRITCTCELTLLEARMESIGLRNFIGFPNVQFSTASTKSSFCCSLCPSLNVSLSSNPLNIMRTLSITISSTKFSSCLVCSLSKITMLVHFNKVESTI